MKKPQDDINLFVLVDESHRTQNGKYSGLGNFARKMRKLLGNACYIGFTGTPLLKREKNTLDIFGGLIHAYTIPQAVKDGAVVPLYYEGRLVEQSLNPATLDQWFDKVSEGLSEQQKADLKRKFSRMSKVNNSLQTLQAKVLDISEHYKKYWQHTGFKAQLVAPSKTAAILMHELLNDIGAVSSEVIISPPSEHEGREEVDEASKNIVQQFWEKMMDRYKSEEAYNREIINKFKSADDPEILIVVSKLLTGFDAPRNTILYLCRTLREHNLLQAIARVNRLFEENGNEKQFGLIIDYEGLLGELDDALNSYSGLEGFDESDLFGMVTDVREQIRRLPHLHDQLWDIFKTIPNKKDMESLEQYLGDLEIREIFYEQLRAFGRAVHVALSSEKVNEVFTEAQLDRFRSELGMFIKLKRSVQIRYQEIIDNKDYEPKIQKLLDQHIIAEPAKKIIDMVNINDEQSLQNVINEQGISEASRADRIASATRRTITENMELDPAFYRRFSELLTQVIADYRAHRLSERDYLKEALEIARKVSKKQRDEIIPASLANNETAMAFYGLILPLLKPLKEKSTDDEIAQIVLDVINIIQKNHVVNLWQNDIVKNRIHNQLDDYFLETVKEQRGFDIPLCQASCRI